MKEEMARKIRRETGNVECGVVWCGVVLFVLL